MEQSSGKHASRRRLHSALLSLAVFAAGLGTSGADTFVSGTISTSTTWTAGGSPYIVTGDVSVQGSTSPVLTIEPGVTVKFNSGTSLLVGLGAAGELQAVGTSAQPILFTANSGTPAAGFWRGIRLFGNTTAASQIAYATVEYGGWAANNYGGIHVEGSSPTVENTTLRNNAYAGITVNAGSPSIQASTLSSNPWGLLVRDNSSVSVGGGTAISNNTSGGIYLWVFGSNPAPALTLSTVSITNNTGFAISIDPRVTFGTVSGLTVSGNGTDAIENRGGSVSINATWKNIPAAGMPNGLAYIVTGDVSVQGSTSPVLAIEPGVTVKFNSGTSLLVGLNTVGGLQAVGTSAQPILFTANSGTPAAGFWRGIRLFGNTTAASQIAYATVEYGGWAANNYGGIHVEGSSPTVENATIRNHALAGISVNGGSPSIQASTLASNPWGLWARDNSLVTVGGGTAISNNTSGGIFLWIFGSNPAPTLSLSTVSVANNTGFAISIDPRVTFGTVSGLTVSGNGTDAIENRGGSVSINATWKNVPAAGMPNGLAYIVTGDVSVQGSTSPVLTIEPGVTVKFNSGTSLLVGLNTVGGLQAVGTSAQAVLFTANSGTPGAGFWRGIRLLGNTTAVSQIAYATVEYGGWVANNYGGIHVASSSPTFDHVRFNANAYAGVSTNLASATLQNCDFTNNSPV